MAQNAVAPLLISFLIGFLDEAAEYAFDLESDILKIMIHLYMNLSSGFMRPSPPPVINSYNFTVVRLLGLMRVYENMLLCFSKRCLT